MAQTAESEAALYRRSFHALDRFSEALVTSATTGDFLLTLLDVFIDVAKADVAVLRLREKDQFRSRAAIGLEEEVAAAYSTPLDAAQKFVADNDLELDAVLPTDSSQSEFLREKGIQAVHCCALRQDEQVVGLLYLGTKRDRHFSKDDKHLFQVLARRAAKAIAQYRTNEALKQAVVDRDEMLATVAHDLGNPINVISLAANSLHQRVSDSTIRRPIERIIRATQRADHLLRDLLEVSAIEGGHFSIEPRRLETANTILAAIESQQSLAAGASIILASDLSPELPSIQADDERLLEVLENLISNAVKFTNTGGSITISASHRENDVLVSVKDNGQGISPEQLPHLFDRFWQARRRDRRGTGLGLTICKAIVEAHGGKIWAESTLGVGTTMFFTLPITGSTPPKVDKPVVASILLVDDRPENIMSLKAILDRPDYRLVTASSGEEALSLALREQFSVALIDIAMPGMDGLEVAVHMKELERSRDVPIIFITAFGDDPDEIHRAYSAGGADYLVKPLDAEIVRKKVAVFVDLNRRRNADELQSNVSES